jgi:hypothetical protein
MSGLQECSYRYTDRATKKEDERTWSVDLLGNFRDPQVPMSRSGSVTGASGRPRRNAASKQEAESCKRRVDRVAILLFDGICREQTPPSTTRTCGREP